MLKIEYPKNSSLFAVKIIAKPTMAQYFGEEAFFKKTPPNIIITPQIADNIIAFINPNP
jgi:hypothetical protein